jgi:hypothetical protein
MTKLSLRYIFVDDKRLLSLIALVIIFICTFTVVPLKAEPAPYVQDFYDVIESLGPEDTVFLYDGIGPTNERESTTVSETPIRRILEKGAKIIWFPNVLYAEIYGRLMLEKILGAPINESPLYGEQVVLISYQPVHYFTLANDPRSVLKKDFFGTPLSDLPVTENWYSMADCDLLLLRGYFVAYDIAVAFVTPYPGVRALEMGDTGMLSGFGAVYTAGLFQGIIPGTTAGAQYEGLIGIIGPSSTFMYSGVILTAYLLILLAGSSIYYLSKRSLGGS